MVLLRCSGAQIKIAFAEYRRMYRSIGGLILTFIVNSSHLSDHRDRGLVLLDLAKIPNDIDRAFVERIAIEQGV